jgi:secreted trypsin-like serine protease
LFNLADVLIFDDYYCRRAYGGVFDPQTELCAGDYAQRTDTMVSDLSFPLANRTVFFDQSGDSGGPLLVRQPDGRWVVLGITSYGSATSPSIAPGVYVKLSAHAKWLDEYLKPA